MFSKKAGVLYFIGYSIRLITPIIPYPIILSKFDENQLNFYLTLLLIGSTAGGFQSGIKNSLIRYMSYLYSGIKVKDFDLLVSARFTQTKIDLKEFGKVVIVSKRIFFLSALIYMLICYLLILVFLKNKLWSFSENDEGLYSIISFITMSSLNLYLNFYFSYLTALRKVEEIQLINVFSSIISAVILLLLASRIVFVYEIIIIVQVGQLIFGILLWIKAFRARNRLYYLIRKTKFSWDHFKVIISKTTASSYTSFLSGFNNNAVGFISNIIFSTSLSAAFLLSKKVMDIITEISMIPYSIYTPDIIELKARREKKKLKKTIIQTNYYTYIIAVISVFVFIISKPAIKYFTNFNGKFLNNRELLIFGILVLINRYIGTKLWLSNIMNIVLEHKSITINTLIIIVLFGLLYPDISIIQLIVIQILGSIIGFGFVISTIYSGVIEDKFWNYEVKLLLPFIILLLMALFII